MSVWSLHVNETEDGLAVGYYFKARAFQVVMKLLESPDDCEAFELGCAVTELCVAKLARNEADWTLVAILDLRKCRSKSYKRCIDVNNEVLAPVRQRQCLGTD
jgi:hypothetical protein